MPRNEDKPNEALELSFRRHSAKITAVLLKRYGSSQLGAIEDAVQNALVSAMESWPFQGVPENPFAWLYTVAKNKLLDEFRKLAPLQNHDVAEFESLSIEPVPDAESDYRSDMMPELQLLFLCCSPQLEIKDRIIVMLKYLGGLDNREIANALNMQEQAINKRVSRTRRKFSAITLPELRPSLVEAQLDAVLTALYLLFNEGYHASFKDIIINDDLCQEALRLCYLLNDTIEHADVKALLALMFFHLARRFTRCDEQGRYVLLSDQDRSAWDNKLIDIGAQFLLASKDIARDPQSPSRFQLEALIASLHVSAPTTDETNWRAITQLYDLLIAIHPSQQVALSRLIAMWKSGCATDHLISQAEILKANNGQSGNPYILTFIGDLYCEKNDPQQAGDFYRAALQQTQVSAQIDVINKKLARLQ